MSGLPPTDYNYPSAGQGMIEKISSNCPESNCFPKFCAKFGSNYLTAQWKKHILEDLFLTVTKIQTFDNQTLILDLQDCQNLINPYDFFQSSV